MGKGARQGFGRQMAEAVKPVATVNRPAALFAELTMTNVWNITGTNRQRPTWPPTVTLLERAPSTGDVGADVKGEGAVWYGTLVGNWSRA